MAQKKDPKTELRYDSDKIPLYTAFKAMDLYAKQEAIGFAEWFVDEKWIPSLRNNKFYQAPVRTDNIEYKTLPELYSLYIQNKPQ